MTSSQLRTFKEIIKDRRFFMTVEPANVIVTIDTDNPNAINAAQNNGFVEV